MGATLHDRVGSEKLLRVSEMLKVAAHPQRLAILDLLGSRKRMCVNDLGNALNIEQAILSQHLAVLRDKGLLTVEKEGRFSFYRVERPDFLRIIRNLENCCDEF
ncbi:MAG: helix-turn-helix transcriptional regulator [Flavobacteriales bacterium]|nr:helix-turn-helix transcriptional regulator [Flavobacteriales bacterium]